MKILVLNSGSSSIKYCLIDAGRKNELLIKGIAERIGLQNSAIRQTIGNNPEQRSEISLPDHRTAMHAVYQELLKNKADQYTIDAAGHRVVHGGEKLRYPTLINEEVVEQIKESARFAPLHCQPNLIGIEVARQILPHVPHVAVFDTAAHATMEAHAFLYGIPFEFYEKYQIRKYGFHGINHQYVAHEAARLSERPIQELKIITCHLGNGCSITAFKHGKSIDNSMGLTPLEGLVMGTRCGDLDPSVVLYLIDVIGLQTAEITDLLNRQSGLLGLSGHSDMRDIIAQADKGDKQAKLTIEIFVYRVQKYIGAYIAALNGVDIIVFTGGIGENSPLIRANVARNFGFLGVDVDAEKNRKNQTIFSPGGSRVVLMNIPANEEAAIAQQTHHLLVSNTVKGSS